MRSVRALLALSFLWLAPAIAHGDGSLGLQGGRFRVAATWTVPATGASGSAIAVPLTAESGLFWFFSPANIELMVKVIDACSVYDRFWVFGSGLTNVEVTLTVEDTWSGRTEQFAHAGGGLFEPFADTASFDVCGVAAPLCGSGLRTDLQASPRPDYEAEELALVLGDGPVATAALYERLRTDLLAIRSADPVGAQATFYNIWWDVHSVLLELTPEAHAAVASGAYDEWNCLNDWYGAALEHTYTYSPWVLLQYPARLHPRRLAEDYSALAGVVRGEPNGFGWPAGGPTPTPGVCAIAGPGAAFDYFFEVGPGYRYYRVATSGAAPELVGAWGGLGAEPQPDWAPRLEDCYAQLDARVGLQP
jgi:hypothetical protein